MVIGMCPLCVFASGQVVGAACAWWHPDKSVSLPCMIARRVLLSGQSQSSCMVSAANVQEAMLTWGHEWYRLVGDECGIIVSNAVSLKCSLAWVSLHVSLGAIFVKQEM